IDATGLHLLRRTDMSGIGSRVVVRVHVATTGHRSGVSDGGRDVHRDVNGKRDCRIAVAGRQGIAARAGQRVYVGQRVHHGDRSRGRSQAHVADSNGIGRAVLATVEVAAVCLSDGQIRSTTSIEAVAWLPLPAFEEVTVTVVFTLCPAVLPTTFTAKVQEPPATIVPPERLTAEKSETVPVVIVPVRTARLPGRGILPLTSPNPLDQRCLDCAHPCSLGLRLRLALLT